METFARIREFVEQEFKVVYDEKFVLGVEIETENGRHQSVFLAELKDQDDHRHLRVETTVAPLAEHDPTKLLRINLMLRAGYLAVGDLDGVPFIKLCRNSPYRFLTEDMVTSDVHRIGRLGDKLEQMLVDGGDWF
ncbi:MAG: hypothetical protein RQ729_06965 [Wenzhouxiangellaceae bacterium]|nr:hypothetical protein [Wenzhouxiangellaceae bacterium]